MSSAGPSTMRSPRTDERLPLARGARIQIVFKSEPAWRHEGKHLPRVARDLKVGLQAELAREGRHDLADVGAVSWEERADQESLANNQIQFSPLSKPQCVPRRRIARRRC